MTIDPNNLAGTAIQTFDDEFNTLSLWNGVSGSGSSGTWDTTYGFASPTGNGSTLTGNAEQEWYINSNYAPTKSVTPWTVSNGYLHLTAAPASASIQPLINNYQYTSGQLNTSQSFSQTYGFFEMRAELPAGQGLWPAFWLLPTSGAWPPELDVMEVLENNPTELYTTAHYVTNGQDGQQGLGSTVANTTTGFHTYAVDWEPDYITWYFDGKAIDRVATPSDMNTPMYMLLNLAAGGSWPGDVNSTTNLPADMTVDWVRAYKANPNAPASASVSASTAVAATGSGEALIAAGAKVTLHSGGTPTSAVLLSNGEIAVVGTNNGGTTGVADVYSASGVQQGGDVALSASASSLSPQVTALPGGYYEVTYSGAGAPASTEIYNSSGALAFIDNQYVKGSPVFATEPNGATVEATANAPGRFVIDNPNGVDTWFNLPNSQATPSAVTTLSDGGFIFSYAGSATLDRYSFSAGVHTSIQLASAPVGSQLGVTGFADGVTEVAWLSAGANGTTSLKLESFGTLGTVQAAAVTLAATVDSTAEIRMLGTGIQDQSLVLWSTGGTVYGASFDGTTASAATALAVGALDGVQSAVLTDGDVALTWTETDNGVEHQWVEVVDPTTMQATRHDLGAATGSAKLVALQGGGFAESWHTAGGIDGVVYDGTGDYGSTVAVSGDFLGVNSQGQVLAVSTGGTGAATLQAYSLSGASSGGSGSGSTGSSGSTPSGDLGGFNGSHDYSGDGHAGFLIQNSNGAIVVGEAGANGQLSYTQVSSIGSAWAFEGSGDFLGQGHDQYLLENANGALDVGSVASGHTTYTQVGAIGPEWSITGTGSYLGAGTSDFLLLNQNGAVDVGSVSGGKAVYTQVAAIGPEWKVVASGDFLGQGHDQFLLQNSNGAIDVGNVVNGQAQFTQVSAIGSAWTIEGSGDFLGDGKSQFLLENANGAVDIGEVGANGHVTYTQVASIGSEWKFADAGDVLNNGHDQFVLENSNGAVDVGNVVNGHAQFTQIGGLGAAWSFHH